MTKDDFIVSKIDKFFDIPKILEQEGTEEDLNKIIRSSNTDIPIEKVKFGDLPNNIGGSLDEIYQKTQP
jgi:hypothetical protein